MRENTRAAVAGLAIVIVLLASGCAHREPVGHGSVGRSPDLTAAVSVPDSVTYAAGAELEGVTSVGMTTTFPSDPDWLSLSGGGSDGITVDLTDEGCSLLLRQGGSADLGIEFVGEDATDTVTTLTALVGPDPTSTFIMLWAGNDGTISVDALIFLVEDAAGEQVLALARAFGSLDAFVYAELHCSAGIAAEAVFAERIAPYLEVSLS